eukprot:CAMPEP_0113296978 /NCGR_PEP_ID=MMETSP0010_2-20120614/34_1 /TAXON_ID=216773 ORGANISM="Corethron hystrix, Strain 308" /NCGR_SAMPLE_ID=MMETSP0010_2 /ASSEMBLY_ACC=CAM_ASM_000155 /LENGTH=192 /DNA_ID=CAMNT_0000149795 /DNA_START=208 /DNA_END=786 /DNA_ORIENTATION=- /assembly_acc=CAM_ASM_000155
MGQTGINDCRDATANLVVASGRAANRPDRDERRNALTSIIWIPTLKSPKLILASNRSDHVHYYQGGHPFRYNLFDPSTGEFSTVVLGPELQKGQKIQVPVKGGVWKCGRMENLGVEVDYSLIGEAVAPGFDFHDFTFVTPEMIQATCKNADVREILLEFIHTDSTADVKTVEVCSEFYKDGERKETRIEERS